MREHFRSFDSRISFFAFADIITAVSGMLIFITLLLATDLGRPTDNRSESANPEMEKRLQDTLTRQAEADLENRRLQGLLTTANTAPDTAKLESDITRLRAELADEKSKHVGAAEELASSKSALDARDKRLGITAVREQIQGGVDELKALKLEEAKVRDEIAALEEKITRVQSKIVKLHAREGQVWLIPDKTGTTKEPILVTVSKAGAKAERFNQPEQTRQFDASRAHAAFEAYLKEANPRNQYIVFLIRPSGIGLFKDLVQLARDKGFEVGFDALEEDREIHFTAPPPIEDEPGPGKRDNAASPAPRQPYSGAGGASPAGTATGDRGEVGSAGTSANGGPVGDPRGTGANRGSVDGSTGTNVNGGPADGSTGTNMNGGAVDGSKGTNANAAGAAGAAGTSQTNVVKGASTGATNQPPPPPPPPKPKSWWQRFLEWIGLG